MFPVHSFFVAYFVVTLFLKHCSNFLDINLLCDNNIRTKLFATN